VASTSLDAELGHARPVEPNPRKVCRRGVLGCVVDCVVVGRTVPG
jgi:hypothetical protein